MADVTRHNFDSPAAAELEKVGVAGDVVLEHGAAKLKALGPFRPTAGRVAAFYREHRGTIGRVPGVLDIDNFPACELKELPQPAGQIGGGDVVVDVNHSFRFEA